MHGHKTHDTEVAAPAAAVWATFRGLGLINFVNKDLSHLGKVEVLEGDGGAGTIFKVTFGPENPIKGYMVEKITKMDDENRVSEIEVIEGVMKDKGFHYFKTKQEVVEKDSGSCIIRSSIECEYDDNNAEAASHVSVKHLQTMAEAIAKHMEQK